jgi:hypothetical protein
MTRALTRMFGAVLAVFPESFRRHYGDEMREVFAQRIADLPAPLAIVATAGEIADIFWSATRFRLPRMTRMQPAMLGVVGTFIIAAAFTVRSLSWAPPPSAVAPLDSIDFRANDPAGEFTIAIRHGRPVAATIDRVPLPASRLLHLGDSIQLLSPTGHVVLAVAYYRERARIEWEPRPRYCRGRAAECAL